MAENYKHLYEQMKLMVEKYQDEIVPGLNNIIDDLRTTGPWISVEDEKPKRRGEYFVAYKFMGSDMQFFGSAFWHDDCSDNGYVKGDHFSSEGVDGMYVTHWMYIPKLPMPDPPKED